MYLDAGLLFSRAQALTGTGATDSSNIIDLSQSRDIGIGEPMELICQVVTGFTSGGAGTLKVDLVTSALADFSSPTTLASSATYTMAQLGAGAQLFRIKMPLGSKRYLKLIYTVGGAAMTAGKVTAGLNLDRQATVNYASGIDTSQV